MKMNYVDWLKTKVKYDGKTKCFVDGCEEHANMKREYQWYLNSNTKDPEICGTW